MRSAVIGVGVIGSLHAQILSERKTLCAVCDIDDTKLKKYENIPVFTDYKKMLDEVRPDVVHICTPHYLHAEMAVYALDNGINVLCEKPLCINLEQMKSILDAEKRSKACLGVCLQNRYNKESVFVKEYLKGKTVKSAVAHMAWHRTKEYYASGDWRGKKATEGGGVLINQALHTLDLLQYFAGQPTHIVSNVCNLTLKNDIEVEDTAVIQGTKGSGITLFATNGASYDMPVVISVRTDTDIIHILPGHVYINGAEQPLDTTYARVLGKECYGSGHELLIDDYYKCLEENRPFSINGKEGSNVVSIILAAYESEGKETEVVYG